MKLSAIPLGDRDPSQGLEPRLAHRAVQDVPGAEVERQRLDDHTPSAEGYLMMIGSFDRDVCLPVFGDEPGGSPLDHARRITRAIRV